MGNKNITLSKIRELNLKRDKEIGSYLNKWDKFKVLSILTEELGEVANAMNALEKLKMDTKDNIDIASELADLLLCVDLLAYKYDVDLNQAVKETFNDKSVKWGCETKF